jgi:hypothetical protein
MGTLIANWRTPVRKKKIPDAVDDPGYKSMFDRKPGQVGYEPDMPNRRPEVAKEWEPPETVDVEPPEHLQNFLAEIWVKANRALQLTEETYAATKMQWRFKYDPQLAAMRGLVACLRNYEPVESPYIEAQRDADKRLRARLDAIDREDLPEDEKRQKKLKAAVNAIDPATFHASIRRGLENDEADARKLYAQIAGLLTEQQATITPVFNFNVFSMPGAESLQQGAVIDVKPELQLTK